jgi:ADP-heptose:LPS heptosyltransferase
VISNNLKILIIRFSSFGDVTQSLSIPSKIKERFPKAEIHFLTRKDFEILFHHHPAIHRLWLFEKKQGLWGLLYLVRELKKHKFSHIYDAHSSTRSLLVSWLLSPPLSLARIFSPPLILRKSQKRWKRFMLFRLRKNYYRQPFSGQRDLLEPLSAWGVDEKLPPVPQLHLESSRVARISSKLADLKFENFIALAPSAAHELKRWPLEYWQKFIELNPDKNFVCLGGPEDHFILDLCKHAPERTLNLAGALDFGESAVIVQKSKALVSNDTGVLHLAEQLGKMAIALMGPAPFGFPSRPLTTVLQLELPCRPCSKHGQGPCVNVQLQKCMRDISPEHVSATLDRILKT